MRYRIVWLRDQKPPHDKAWVRSIRRDGTFRFTSAPNLAKSWAYRSAPERAIKKRAALPGVLKPGTPGYRRIEIESFANPYDVNPYVLPVDELMELGIL